MIEKLRAEGHSAAEIVNHLLLGREIQSAGVEVPRKKKTRRELYESSREPWNHGKRVAFNPTPEEIESGKQLLRESRDENKLNQP